MMKDHELDLLKMKVCSFLICADQIHGEICVFVEYMFLQSQVTEAQHLHFKAEQQHKIDLDTLQQRIKHTLAKKDATIRQLKEELADKTSQLEDAQQQLHRQRAELLAHLT